MLTGIKTWRSGSPAHGPVVRDDTTRVGVQCQLNIRSVEVNLGILPRTWIIPPTKSSTHLETNSTVPTFNNNFAKHILCHRIISSTGSIFFVPTDGDGNNNELQLIRHSPLRLLRPTRSPKWWKISSIIMLRRWTSGQLMQFWRGFRRGSASKNLESSRYTMVAKEIL